ncbi:MAG: sodium:proton antiporter, partial [Pseudomonadota bacterium]
RIRKWDQNFLLAAAAMSAVMNNTPLIMLMIPVAIRIAAQTEQSPSKILIPLSYAAILGGTCTLIGTSTNLLVDSVAREAGLAPFHIFEV